MGLIQKYRNWTTGKRLKRLESDLVMIRNKINFDPRFALTIKDLNSPEAFTKRIEEYRVWFSGNKTQLRSLYKDNIKKDCLNYFWYKAPETYRMLHAGLPGLISDKQPTILFGGGVKFEATAYTEAGEKDEKLSTRVQELMDHLVKELKFSEKIETGATIESWSGHLFGKFSFNVALSNYPIFEVTDLTKAEAIKERGITKAIVFKYWYQFNKKHYRLDEIYTTNAVGDAVIRYELYMLDNINGEKQVPVETIPEGYELKFTNEGLPRLNKNDEFVFDGIKGMLAFDKPNKTPSHEFPDSQYGASDYEGSIDAFDATDEAFSELMQELRDNKTIRYVPETMIPTKSIYDNGEELVIPMLNDAFVTNYVMIGGDEDQSTKNELKIQQIPDKTESLVKKYQIALTMAINKAGMSPVALGITGLESISASAESQQERNKATLETRSKKLKNWKPFLEEVGMKMLELNAWMQRETFADQEAFGDLRSISFNNLDIGVSFGDYIIERQADKITTWGSAKQMGVASIETVVDKIHDEWTETQKLEEVQRIKFQNAIAMDTPDTLQFDELLKKPPQEEQDEPNPNPEGGADN